MPFPSYSTEEPTAPLSSVAVIGTGDLAYSIATCFLLASYAVTLCTENPNEAGTYIRNHAPEINREKLIVNNAFQNPGNTKLIIAVTDEGLLIKQELIASLEKMVDPSATIAINTESIRLDQLQENAAHPSRIIGLNWTEPAHTTLFLEIITNEQVSPGVKTQINKIAETIHKDAYTVENSGVRSRLMSAMIREAFYLVEKGYASVEDIDRACRNDAGYYLPFAGNCRYMDLMGTYAYGMVMKDLNPDLSTARELPFFFTKILETGGEGMKNGKGLYDYTPEEVKNWKEVFNEFSQQIGGIMKKYPFNYPQTDLV
ncbi:MAG: 3-hydroxyacyl-CoA dehydrogenase NAD-binding domain-containing protein [Chitinophagaceae bacterium]